MYNFFIFFQIFLLLFFILFKDYNKISNQLLLIFVKINIFFVVFFMPSKVQMIFFIIYAAMVILILFIFLILSKNIKIYTEFKREYFLFLAALFILLFFGQGCINGNKYPSYHNEIKLNFEPGKIFVLNKDIILIAAENSNRVFEYDLKNNKIIKTIKTGYSPLDIKYFNKKIFISNYLGNSITIYNPEDDTSQNIQSGGLNPCDIEINKEKRLIYVANMSSNNVTVIDLNGNKIKTKISTGKWPSDLYLSQDNRYLYVTCKYTNTIEIIDAENEKHIFSKVQTGISPTKIIPLNNKELAVLNEWEYVFNLKSTIIIFDMYNYKVNDSIKVDGGIFDGTLSKSKKYIYISVPTKDKILFVNVKSKQKVHELNLEDDIPRYLAISEDGKQLFISAQNSKKLIIIDLKGFN